MPDSKLTKTRKWFFNIKNIIKLIFFLLAGVAVVKVVQALDPDKKLRAERDSLTVVLADVREGNVVEVENLLVTIVELETGSRSAARRARDTVLNLLVALENARQGEIVIDTQFIELDGGVDTIPIAHIVVVGFTHPVPVPVPVAQEIQACRAVAETCEQFADTVEVMQTELDSLLGRPAIPATDSTPEVPAILGYVPMVLDTLEAEIRMRQDLQQINKKLTDGRRLNLGLFTMPMPNMTCGVGGGYRITGGDGASVEQQFDDVSVTGTVTFSRWAGFAGCLVGWRVLGG